MNKLNKTRNNFVVKEISRTIIAIQDFINQYKGEKQRHVIQVIDTIENTELLKQAVCTYLDNSEYRDIYFIKDKSSGFELAFNMKFNISKEQLGLVYDEDNNFKGTFTYNHFIKQKVLKSSNIRFKPITFTADTSKTTKKYNYVFIPLIEEMREDRKASQG